MHDQVEKFLRSRGCPDHIVKGGLLGLVDNWERIVHEVAEGYTLGLDDYVNDMDGRQLLEEALLVATPQHRQAAVERMTMADSLMRKVVVHFPVCLWGEQTARERGWTKENNWWYFAAPIKAGPELVTDLKGLR